MKLEDELFNKYLNSYQDILKKLYEWFKANLESIIDITEKNEIRKLYIAISKIISVLLS